MRSCLQRGLDGADLCLASALNFPQPALLHATPAHPLQPGHSQGLSFLMPQGWPVPTLFFSNLSPILLCKYVSSTCYATELNRSS